MVTIVFMKLHVHFAHFSGIIILIQKGNFFHVHIGQSTNFQCSYCFHQGACLFLILQISQALSLICSTEIAVQV